MRRNTTWTTTTMTVRGYIYKILKKVNLKRHSLCITGSENVLGIGDLIVHANPREDPYLVDPDLDDDESDVEDFEIKPTDSLIVTGHVEGSAAILEVYGKITRHVFP